MVRSYTCNIIWPVAGTCMPLESFKIIVIAFDSATETAIHLQAGSKSPSAFLIIVVSFCILHWCYSLFYL